MKSLDPVVRQIWGARLTSTALVVGSALVAALVQPLAVPLLVFAIGVEGVVALLLARLVRALRKGDEGEVLLQLGPRVPLRVYRDQGRGERAEAAAHAVVALGGSALVAETPWGFAAQAVLLGSLLVMLLLARVRRQSQALIESTVALSRLDAKTSERWLPLVEDSRLPTWQKAARGHRTTHRLWRGDAAGALAEMEADWSGTLDADAAGIATLRLGLRDDPELARRWLAASEPTQRFQRWLHASVAGPLALAEGRWEAAIAACADPAARDVPPFFVRQLDIVRAAALRGAGRVEEGDRVLAELDPPVDREPWRGVAHPRTWALLGRDPVAPAPAPSPAPAARAPAATPFAPPAEPSRRPPARRPRWRGTGAIPVEHVPLASSGRHLVLHALSSLTLVGLAPGLIVAGPLLLVLDPSLWTLGASCLAVGSFGLVIGILRGVDLLLARPRIPGQAAVALGDGRLVPRNLWWWFALRSVSPFLNLVILLLALLSVSEGLSVGSWTIVFVALPLAALYAWAGARRYRFLQLVGAQHFLPAAEGRERAERELAGSRVGRNPARLWLGLARLWAGDAAGAEEVAREELDLDPQAAFLLRWIRAGRGEADLDALLAAPEAEATGDRYRAAVTLALAALHAGRADRVHARCADWAALAREVPNRYGALLVRLTDAVRRACGEAVPPSDDPELAWVQAVWPFAR